jgi:hypothetical protein
LVSGVNNRLRKGFWRVDAGRGDRGRIRLRIFSHRDECRKIRSMKVDTTNEQNLVVFSRVIEVTRNIVV